jgi:hypothetical protein
MFTKEFKGSGNYFSQEGSTAAVDTETIVLPFKLTKSQMSELTFTEYEEVE